MANHKIGVLVSGRGSNLQAIIDKIRKEKLPIDITVVISDSPEAYALTRAREAGIPALAVLRQDFPSKAAFETAIDDALRKAGVELVVLAGFMRILSGDFVNKWPQAIINIHPALLPAFKGLDAQGQALQYGVKIAGCTVHFVDAGMDSGPIILQKAVPVLDEDTHDTLAARILVQEHTILPEAVKLWSEGRLEVKGRKVRIRKA
jgi:phosphoribosylglycinamide formyltransferase-1